MGDVDFTALDNAAVQGLRMLADPVTVEWRGSSDELGLPDRIRKCPGSLGSPTPVPMGTAARLTTLGPAQVAPAGSLVELAWNRNSSSRGIRH